MNGKIQGGLEKNETERLRKNVQRRQPNLRGENGFQRGQLNSHRDRFVTGGPVGAKPLRKREPEQSGVGLLWLWRERQGRGGGETTGNNNRTRIDIGGRDDGAARADHWLGKNAKRTHWTRRGLTLKRETGRCNRAGEVGRNVR